MSFSLKLIPTCMQRLKDNAVRYTGHYHKYLFSLHKDVFEEMQQKKLDSGLTWNLFFEKYILEKEEKE